MLFVVLLELTKQSLSKSCSEVFFWSLADRFHWLGHYKQIFFGLETGKYFSKVLIFEI
jgi:hypothetical protein